MKDGENILKKVMLSVIIPAYNVAPYIHQCLESVVKQTLSNIQIICIDDGSTDGTNTIIQKYVNRDKRFTLIEQSNKGAGTARNLGIKYATGKYVHFLDSDDWLEPNAYETIINKLESSGCDSCIFQRYNYDNITRESIPSIRAFRSEDYITNFENNPSFFIHSPVVPWNKITLLEVIIKNNIKYDEIACGNDRTFYFNLVKHCKNIMVCRDILLHYRVNNSKSTVGVNRSINFDAHFKAYRSTMSIYAEDSDDIKKMVSDVCITDIFFFFDKSEIRFKENIYHQLHEFFNNLDLSIFHNTLANYAWWKRLEYIRDHSQCPEEYLINTPAPEVYITPKPSKNFIHPNKEVIVSLTSFPARIKTVDQTITSIMLNQSIKANRVILWLAIEQFPNLEKDLSQNLLKLKKYGLEIRFCDDLKPHKKYYYAMRENPESIIITIDDDVLYDSNTIEDLLNSYNLFPNCISARRVHRVVFLNNDIAPYSEWRYNDDTFYHHPSMSAMATGVGGVLYPPHIFPHEVFDKNTIKETCLFADDLWLKINEVRNSIPTVLSSFNKKLSYIEGSQDTALWKTNKECGANDTQLKKILEHFHDEKENILKILSDKNG